MGDHRLLTSQHKHSSVVKGIEILTWIGFFCHFLFLEWTYTMKRVLVGWLFSHFQSSCPSPVFVVSVYCPAFAFIRISFIIEQVNIYLGSIWHSVFHPQYFWCLKGGNPPGTWKGGEGEAVTLWHTVEQETPIISRFFQDF